MLVESENPSAIPTSPVASEFKGHEELTLPRRNPLTRLRNLDVVAIHSYCCLANAAESIYVVHIRVSPTDAHAVENVAEFGPQLKAHSFSKEESLTQRHAFICKEREAQTAQVARLIPLPETRVREGLGAEHMGPADHSAALLADADQVGGDDSRSRGRDG